MTKELLHNIVGTNLTHLGGGKVPESWKRIVFVVQDDRGMNIFEREKQEMF